MNRKEKINIEVEKTLNAFEKVDELESNPFLITRLQAKLDEDNLSANRKNAKNLAAIISPAVFLVIFIINIYTIFNVYSTKTTQPSQNVLDLFAKEYSLGENSYYNNNNFNR